VTLYEKVGTWQGLDAILGQAPRGTWARHVVVPRLDRYQITVYSGCLAHWATELAGLLGGGNRAWVVADETVWAMHGSTLTDSRDAQMIIGGVLALPPGEKSKSLEHWSQVGEWLAANRALRRDIVVAFGGSVISDLVGFVAATYMRGVPYVNIPTTLLSQVDGAIGGKVAINTPDAKNLIGAFWHPAAVLTDPLLLETLPRAEVAAGLGEVIKTAAVESQAAFEYLEGCIEKCLLRDRDSLTNVVRMCASIKMHLLNPDPYEVDLRRVLNFGHTVGHAIETAKGYRGIRHGEAVGLGMLAASTIGLHRGLTPPGVHTRLGQLVGRANLPTSLSHGTVDDILDRIDIIAAIRNGNLRFVVPIDIGRMAIIEDVQRDEIANALASLCEPRDVRAEPSSASLS
jgi:3-dehydroquinate synthase